MSHPYRGIAIVIGISKYENIDKLEGAVNDATEMTKNLREYHFDVIDLIDPSIDQITSGVIELNSRLSINSYNVVVVYYAGHGVADFNSHFILGPEYAYKANQLMINGVNIEEDIIGKICAISVPAHKKRSLLVILDTCRKKTERSIDPFRLIENEHGNEATIGILVGYACGRGLGATDGHHGLYTQFILEEFFKPGICVLDALSAVNIRVANAGSKSQKPQMVVDDVNCFKFCLNQPPKTLEELNEEIEFLKYELKRKSIALADRTEENIKIKTELEEQRYTREGMRTEYHGKIAALDNNVTLLRTENEKLKLENKKFEEELEHVQIELKKLQFKNSRLEEELEHVQISQEKFKLENSTREEQVGDMDVMERIYELTGGSHWIKNKSKLSWQPNSYSSEFKEAYGRITCIRLSSNNLRGSIPSELGRLSGLILLSLASNRLNGAIPAEFGELKNLKHLDLRCNQLTGALPLELGKLSRLEELWLHSNELTGTIPVEFGKLSKLTDLNLAINQLTGPIPVEVLKLSKLNHIFLNNNQLTGEIPSELGELPNLVHVCLNCNQLTGEIPLELGKLSTLVDLYLNDNELTGNIPVALGKLKNLKNLDLSGNQLTGGPPMIPGCQIVI